MPPAHARRSWAIQRRTDLRGPEGLEAAVRQVENARPDGAFVFGHSQLVPIAPRLFDSLARLRVPTVGVSTYARHGALLSYGINYADQFRQAARFVDRIFKGAKAADLPVERATKFDLLINLRTAKAIGLTIAPSLLLRADEVIE